jgi:ribonuclease HI
MVEPVIIYTDGACKGNPGKGGWGAWLRYKTHEKEIYGGEPKTTNNRMELMAAIQALEGLKKASVVTLYTDSVYVKEGINKWIKNWKKRGWKTSNKQSVKNEDLWRRLDEAREKHQVTWQWIKGHSGNVGNEKADYLANKGVDSLQYLDKDDKR